MGTLGGGVDILRTDVMRDVNARNIPLSDWRTNNLFVDWNRTNFERFLRGPKKR
jgi:hypothetical protein